MDKRPLADVLYDAHSRRTRAETSAAFEPQDLASVYRIQDTLYEKLAYGARPVAWKVGAASADAEPTIAPILPRRLLESPARAPADEFHMIGVEAEIAFRYSGGQFEALVAIELCDARFADWKTASTFMKLADNQMNWGLVAGERTSRWQQIDFDTVAAELWIGGEQRVAVRGGHPYGNPFRLIAWTRRHLAKRGLEDLKDGDIVTTGSWGGMHFAQPGEEIVARFPGVGEARAVVT
jgi:2-keto-4-pentenoate hydratase